MRLFVLMFGFVASAAASAAGEGGTLRLGEPFNCAIGTAFSPSGDLTHTPAADVSADGPQADFALSEGIGFGLVFALPDPAPRGTELELGPVHISPDGQSVQIGTASYRPEPLECPLLEIVTP